MAAYPDHSDDTAELARRAMQAASVAAKGGGKPALDNDFLDGLLDDPLANKGKK